MCTEGNVELRQGGNCDEKGQPAEPLRTQHSQTVDSCIALQSLSSLPEQKMKLVLCNIFIHGASENGASTIVAIIIIKG